MPDTHYSPWSSGSNAKYLLYIDIVGFGDLVNSVPKTLVPEYDWSEPMERALLIEDD